jgi:hypothetical protein
MWREEATLVKTGSRWVSRPEALLMVFLTSTLDLNSAGVYS